jgi:hypothetical protein
MGLNNAGGLGANINIIIGVLLVSLRYEFSHFISERIWMHVENFNRTPGAISFIYFFRYGIKN